MKSSFFKLSLKQQEQIINAALEEFTKQGYAKASTNTIVEKAEISKGMLFYYFNNKQTLFNFLIDYGIDFIKSEYFAKIDDSEPDFIKRYKGIAKVKMESYSKNPYVYNFLGTIYLNGYKNVPEKKVEVLTCLTKEAMEGLYKDIDYSIFRNDINPEKILKFIAWSFDGYEKELSANLEGMQLNEVDYAPYWDEFDEYIELLKKLFYKQDGEE